jgi:hypothetical protein
LSLSKGLAQQQKCIAMKINGPGSVRTSTPRRKSGTDGASAGDFASHMGTVRQSAGSPVSSASQISSVETLIALQSTGDATQSANDKEVDRAEDILDRLDQIRVGILTGSMSRGALTSIVHRLSERRRDSVDPRLASLIDEVELRAKVELAKLSMI